VDIGPRQIANTSLHTALTTSLPANDEVQEAKVVAHIIDLLKTRKDPVIVFDGGRSLTVFLDYILVKSNERTRCCSKQVA
jgi:hypothetical protein